MKDFYDLRWLADHYEFDGQLLSKAMVSTFERRKTTLPEDIPVGLSEEFFKDKGKQTQWNAFSKKLFSTPSETFEEIGMRLRVFILPPLLKREFKQRWNPKAEWM